LKKYKALIMKKMQSILLALLVFAFLSSESYAQEQKKEIEVRIEKQSDVKKKGSDESLPGKKKKEQTVTVTIKKDKGQNGEQIIINGSPMGSFDNMKFDTSILQTIIIKGDDGEEIIKRQFNFKDLEMGGDFLKNFQEEKEEVTPFLGVLTEKVPEGARVVEVTKESAAEKAGLQKNDIITKVGEENISDPAKLAEIIGSKKPKEKVKLYYTRDRKKANAQVTLGERRSIKKTITMKGSPDMGKVFAIPNTQGNPMEKMIIIEDGKSGRDFNSPGRNYELKLDNQQEYTNPNQRKLGLRIQDLEEGEGVKVIDIEKESAAEKAGLQKGDILVLIGGVKVANTDDARQELRPSPSKNSYTIKAKRAGKEMTFEVKYPKKIKTLDL
jgi:serine protease Do